MDREAKYVVIDFQIPLLFPDHVNHDFFVGGKKATSAGFCRIYSEDGELKVSVYGESVRLRLKARPEDADLIKRMFVEPNFW